MRFGAFLVIFVFLLTAAFSVSGQTTAVLNGTVVDTVGKPIKDVNILVSGDKGGTSTNSRGKFSLTVPASQKIDIVLTHQSYKQKAISLTLEENEERAIQIEMIPSQEVLPGYQVTADRDQDIGMDKVPGKVAPFMASVSMNPINDLIKITGLGVRSNNELSSQYSVRGGNFDENLIYVNGIEIYRPFLVRSGQQEGLSFVNADLTESVWFSAGGFNAQYGDKMSSVLDVTYKKPISFGGRAALSLQGASFSFENATEDHKWRYMAGFRQKSNQYVLNSLETSGEYQPSFTDFQTYITFAASKKLEISFLGNYARNSYKFYPQDRETRFGTLDDALRFKVYFDGQEVDKFESQFGALDFTWKPTKKFNLSFVTSYFHSEESETYDIIGQYWLDALNLSFGSETFGDVAFNKGVGTFFNHARNYLTANIVNFQMRGSYHDSSHFQWTWGANYQIEMIDDKLNEWQMIDSAGYSIPHRADSIGYTVPSLQNHGDLELKEYYNTDISLNTRRVTAFLQNTWKDSWDSRKTRFSLTTGVRMNYWDYSGQLLISPRFTAAYQAKDNKKVLYRLSGGYYYQPAFYRELKTIDGQILQDVEPQKSIQFVGGVEWYLKLWDRDFKFVSEAYYKDFQNLIPYELDNIRIRYFADMTAKGYAVGLDMKLNGEFVKGVESYVGISLMRTREDIAGDYYYEYYNKYDSLIIFGVTQDENIAYSIKREAGFKPRPTDQLLNFNLFFQDHMPGMEDLKMHLNLVWGTRLPFGPPKTKNYKEPGRMKAYKRVDIGFSKQLVKMEGGSNRTGPFRFIDNLWISVEVFNLLQFSNNMAYTWITDVNNNQYAIPSRLTPRQLNVKILMDF